MSEPPRLSVVMPVFNGARWLPESLASIRAQAVPDLELIVVDDGSTDDSAEVVRRDAPAARYVRQENRGHVAARNRGLGLARAGLVAFLDQDDLWPDGSLARRCQALQAAPAALFVQGRTRFLGAGGEPEPWVAPNLGAGLFRRELFARTGPFREDRRLTDDVDWFLRVRESGLPYLTLDEVTLHYRRGTGGVTHGRTWRDAEVLVTLRDSLARRRVAGRAAALPLLSGSPDNPRAAGPVNHGQRTDQQD